MRHIFKILSFLFALVAINSVQAQSFSSIYVGTPTFDLSGSFNEPYIDSSVKKLALGFLPGVSKTTSQVRIYVSQISGTPVAGDGVLSIYGDTNGKPGSLLTSATFDPSTTGWKDVAISQALTAGTQYWFVFTNANVTCTATPGSCANQYALLIMPDGLAGVEGGGISTTYARWGATYNRSDDNGVTWDVAARGAGAAYRVKWSDNTYAGYPAQYFDSANTPVNAGDRIYAAREVGNLFTTPANADLKLHCISFHVNAIGTPTGTIRYRLYSGTTLVATTASIGATTTIANQGFLPLCFSTPQTLTAGGTYRAVIGENTQSDTSSNAYGTSRIDWDADANSQGMKPFAGTITKTVCSSACSGGTWTDSVNSWYPMQLILSFGDEFVATGGGGSGGLINQNNMSGGMQ